MPNIIHQPNNLVNSSGLKIAFLGTPEFAVPVLTKLSQSEFKPVAVFCAPDKPVGRKQIMTPPPTKIIAQKHNIPVFQPANSHELAYTLNPNPYSLIISAAYGIIISKEVLNTPNYGCLNIHPSLLPKYRGASPIQAAILNGDSETGVTIFKMNEGVDTGAIIANSKWPMANGKITTPELSKELAELGADLLLKTLSDWIAGKITPVPQDNSQTTYAPQIKKENGHIDWQKTAAEIERQIRAYFPWPGSHTYYSSSESAPGGEVEKSKLKILKADLIEKNYQKQIGEVFLTDKQNLAVQTGNGCLIIQELQIEGGKSLPATDFLRGRQDIVGQVLN